MQMVISAEKDYGILAYHIQKCSTQPIPAAE
jgi:hypothetical protein